jgi:hypothetical protein
VVPWVLLAGGIAAQILAFLSRFMSGILPLPRPGIIASGIGFFSAIFIFGLRFATLRLPMSPCNDPAPVTMARSFMLK